MAVPNPFAFRPAQVTLWTTIVYIALLVPIIVTQESVPSAPSESALPKGISLSQAWDDLGTLTQTYHPSNSHANDNVRSFLLQRIHDILDDNGVIWKTQMDRVSTRLQQENPMASRVDADAVVFDDMLSNVTFFSSSSDGQRSAVHYQGTNVYVYIRGTKDEAGDWWKSASEEFPMDKKLVLVNAHFDSVTSGYGATDDGVGVVSALQLVRYFTTPGHQPRRGVVVLLNNAEEDFLLGASAFVNSPLSPFIGTFVNLEGAGAGGKAILFRATDLEVVSAYQGTSHPFSTVFSSDSFKLGLIRSETDYRVWVDSLGYRGLDISFFRPRARYHTGQDDRRHTSKDSIWHMLSSALESTRSLSGSAGDRALSKKATDGVWFDLFGSSLALFALRGLFAWSLTILIVSPIVLGTLFYTLNKIDKNYMFSASAVSGGAEAAIRASTDGWKGFFRFPIAFAVAECVLVGTALLLKKVQPFIIHSNLYAVLAMMTSLFYVVFWAVMYGANAFRPSALHRSYTMLWLYVITWALLLMTAVLEDRDRIASGYFVAFWASSVFLALTISLVEIFSLQKKATFASNLVNMGEEDGGSLTYHDNDASNSGPNDSANGHSLHDSQSNNDDPLPTEQSPLIGGNARTGRLTTFSTGYRRSVAALLDATRLYEAKEDTTFFGAEQSWSGYLPTWTWLAQFLILGPFNIILTAQLGLALASAVHQTGIDGSNLLMPYLLFVFFITFLLLPLAPFIHRVTRHLPLFLFAVFAGSLVYCLTIFPFSAASPFKFYVRQVFSADTGNTSVVLTGYEGYVDMIKASLPSSSRRPWSCVPASGRQNGLVDCMYDGSGLEPHLDGANRPFAEYYAGLVTVNASRTGPDRKAMLEINAVDSKSCTIRFERPVKDVFVRGSLGWDSRFHWAPDAANWTLAEITLWRRDWETPWAVDVDWEADSEEAASQSLSGTVVCRWADINTPGTVPAADEALKYAPTWSIMTIKTNPPLLQGSKRFLV